MRTDNATGPARRHTPRVVTSSAAVIALTPFGPVVHAEPTTAATHPLFVQCPDGTPAVNATATTLYPPPYSYWVDGHLHPPVGEGLVQVQADGHGRLDVPDVPSRPGMLVLHERGYAEFPSVPTSGTVRLVPWSRVTGRLVLDGGRAANQTVQAHLYQRAPNWTVIFLLRSRTDGQGRFTFDRLPAGVALLPPPAMAPVLTIGRVTEGYATAQDTVVHVVPGQPTDVTVGGTGRAVVCRVNTPAVFVGRQDWRYQGDIQTVPNYPPAYPMPEDVTNGPVARREDWKRAYFKTDAGKAYVAAMDAARDSFRVYPMEFGPDGSFRVEDVPAGHYKADVRMYYRAPGPDRTVGDQLAAGSATFSVPAMPGRHDATPLVIPPIDVEPERVAAVGKPAPPFSLSTLEGKPLRLSDYRGRYVVLDFWATWCGPCVADLPSVQRLYDDVRPTGRVAFVGLSLDEGPAKPLSYVRAHHISWDQAWAGGSAGAAVLQSYPSPNGIPQCWLIDPAGQVVAEGQRVEQLRPALVEALAGRPGTTRSVPVP